MRVRPWAVFIVLVLVAVGAFIAWRHKAEVRVTAGAITFDIDPITGDVGVSADPLLFISKFVKVEVGAGIEPEDGEQVVVSANFLIDAESNLKAALKGFAEAAPQASDAGHATGEHK